MKWVKASERRPQTNDWVFCKHTNGRRDMFKPGSVQWPDWIEHWLDEDEATCGDGWVAVENPPNTTRNVLAVSKKGRYAITCFTESGIDNFELESDPSDYFTHWQPLPPSPKKSKQ